MGFFSKLFGGSGGNPANAGMGYLNQIPGMAKGYLEPFIKRGAESQDFVTPFYSQMAKDPNAFMNAIMANYSPSQGYQFKQKELMRAMQNDAAQGGFAGTPYSQQQQAETTQGLLGNDMQQFLQNILGIQGYGLGGHQGIADRGYNASGDLVNILGSNLGQQAGLAFQGAAQRNQNRMSNRNMWMNLLGNTAQAASNAYGFHKLGG